MEPRKIDSETRRTVLVVGFRGESPPTHICRKYQISEGLYYRWRDQCFKAEVRPLVSETVLVPNRP